MNGSMQQTFIDIALILPLICYPDMTVLRNAASSLAASRFFRPQVRTRQPRHAHRHGAWQWAAGGRFRLVGPNGRTQKTLGLKTRGGRPKSWRSSAVVKGTPPIGSSLSR